MPEENIEKKKLEFTDSCSQIYEGHILHRHKKNIDFKKQKYYTLKNMWKQKLINVGIW